MKLNLKSVYNMFRNRKTEMVEDKHMLEFLN